MSRILALVKEHRQELFEDGLSADLHGMSLAEAFVAGCEQEREALLHAIQPEAPQQEGD